MKHMFTGVRRAYVLLVLYVMKTIERTGTDEAFKILEEAADRQGAIIHRRMKRELPPDLTPLETGAEVYRRFMMEAGADVSIHKKEQNSVTFVVKRCPFHEAFLDVGVDCGMFLSGLCSNLTLPSIQATLTRFDERLKVEAVLVKETAEEICLERVYLALEG